MRTLSIDWLAYTIKGSAFVPFLDTELLLKTLPNLLQSETVVEERGVFGYTMSALGASGAKALFSGDHRMGLHIIWPGSALIARDAIEIIEVAFAHGAEFTRVDVALDMDAGDVKRFVDAFEKGEYFGRRRTHAEIKSANGGHTLYIGSRSSDQMLRIYNKAAQMGVRETWIRAELETKGDLANGVCKFLVQHKTSLANAALGVITAFISFPDVPAWETGGLVYENRGGDKGARKTREWALNAVKTQAKLCMLDRDFEETLFAMFVAEGVDFSRYFASKI